MPVKTQPEVTAQQREIGQFIQELRKQRHITQQDFARALKTSQSAVARMEKGEQNFSTEMLLKISSVLDKDIITLSKGTVSYQVEGGRKLVGSIEVNTSKNGAVALLFASLLNRGATTLKKVPHIEEVHRIIEVLTSIGVSVKWEGDDVIVTSPNKLQLSKLDVAAATRTRSVIMLLGALSSRLNGYTIPYPGGCKLGSRTTRPHLFALAKLGLKINRQKNLFQVTSSQRQAGEVIMYEASDTATENAILAAAAIHGKTTIKFASANYMVQELCYFLQELGVNIEGIGTTTLVIHGQTNTNKSITYELSEDPIEAMLFIASGVTTNSSITIERCPIGFLEVELLRLEKMGLKYKILKRYLARNKATKLADIKILRSKLTAPIEQIHAAPFPAINIDNLPFFVPIATQAAGTTLIHDWVFENRAIYYAELNKLGANIVLADPHRAYVTGPTQLSGAEIVCPPALRPAAIILVAMLAAKGTSILRNVYSINRGYEDICPRLNKLGARIKILRGIT